MSETVGSEFRDLDERAQSAVPTTVALSGVEVCKPGDVGIEFEADAPAALRDVICEYLARFDAPLMLPVNAAGVATVRCSCGAWISGMFGYFEWGLAHGEGFCGECKRPARAYHSIRDKDGEVIRFTAVLLYALMPDKPNGVQRDERPLPHTQTLLAPLDSRTPR